MGFSRNSYSNSIEPLQSLMFEDDDGGDDCEVEDQEVKFESLLYKMIWDFGLACAIPRRRAGRTDSNSNNCSAAAKLEHNKAWLLAETGGCGGDEAYSGHSSFRFSLCSQVELESMTPRSATVLMVNLNNDVKWRRVESLERSISPVAHSLIRFNYSQILSATRNFSQGRVLGRGALSCVFRGRVGLFRTAVAIKRLDKENKECSKAFCRELMIASSLHNPYIVPLLGFCIDDEGGLFLVYRYVSGGSLDQFLHGKARSSSPLPWLVRYRVAMGIAKAIEYLHNGTERCVVHRDIKPSNILISSKKIPKLCDFGLATWTPAPSVPFLCKTVKGTFGYLAPEYFQHGRVSDKTDIFAFGVVLLELITGRKPIESRRGPGEENLVLWAKPHLQQGNAEKILDPCLKLAPENSNQVARMIRAATACIHNEESRRPDMGEIITILRGDESMKRKTMLLSGNSTAAECYPHLQRTKSEMKSHFALAMLGVEESR